MTPTKRFQTLFYQNPVLAKKALAELGYVHFETDQGCIAARERGIREGIEIGMKEAAAVINLCRQTNLNLQQAEKMIDDGLDRKAAVETILAIIRKQDHLLTFATEITAESSWRKIPSMDKIP